MEGSKVACVCVCRVLCGSNRTTNESTAWGVADSSETGEMAMFIVCLAVT